MVAKVAAHETGEFACRRKARSDRGRLTYRIVCTLVCLENRRFLPDGNTLAIILHSHYDPAGAALHLDPYIISTVVSGVGEEIADDLADSLGGDESERQRRKRLTIGGTSLIEGPTGTCLPTPRPARPYPKRFRS